MSQNIRQKGKIELGLPEFEPDMMFKQQITHNLEQIHVSLLNMDRGYSPNFDLLVDCLITAITPYEKQEALFELKSELMKEYAAEEDNADNKNIAKMRANMRILGLCREHFADKYMESRVSVII